MKEAYGGLTNLYVFFIFFVIYVCFLAIALNFAKTYRIKNYVINTLEQYQYTGEFNANESALRKIDDYLAYVPYGNHVDAANAYCGSESAYNGVCIIPLGDDDNRYYRVVVFFEVEFPFLKISKFSIPISGETMIIHQTT